MIETSSKLLRGIRTDPRAPEWAQLYALYQPFLYSWARKAALQHADAEDVVQDVFAELQKALPEFDYDRTRGKFRNWLRRVFCNRVREFRRSKQNRERAAGGDGGTALVEQLEDANSRITAIDMGRPVPPRCPA